MAGQKVVLINGHYSIMLDKEIKWQSDVREFVTVKAQDESVGFGSESPF